MTLGRVACQSFGVDDTAIIVMGTCKFVFAVSYAVWALGVAALKQSNELGLLATALHCSVFLQASVCIYVYHTRGFRGMMACCGFQSKIRCADLFGFKAPSLTGADGCQQIAAMLSNNRKD